MPSPKPRSRCDRRGEKTAPDLAAPELMLARAVAMKSNEGGRAAERGGESHGGARCGSASAAAWPRCTTPRWCGGAAGWQMGTGNPEENEQTGACESIGSFGSCHGPLTAVSDGFELDRTP
jgi:hypothetical protein